MSDTCKVAIFTGERGHGRGAKLPECGQPVVRYGLCEQHASDKERLS